MTASRDATTPDPAFVRELLLRHDGTTGLPPCAATALLRAESSTRTRASAAHTCLGKGSISLAPIAFFDPVDSSTRSSPWRGSLASGLSPTRQSRSDCPFGVMRRRASAIPRDRSGRVGVIDQTAPEARFGCRSAGNAGAVVARTIAFTFSPLPSMLVLRRPSASRAARRASSDNAGPLTPALLLRQERGHQARADAGFRSGRDGEAPGRLCEPAGT